MALSIENGLLHGRMTTQIAQLRWMHAFTVDLAAELEVGAVAQRVADAVVSEGRAGASAVVLPGRAPIASAGDGSRATGGRGWHHDRRGDAGDLAVTRAARGGLRRRRLLRHLLGLAGLALEKALLYEHSREQARRDSLTGLLAHRPFHEAIAELERAAEPFSLVIADIDDFKQVNDLYGHPPATTRCARWRPSCGPRSAPRTACTASGARSSAYSAGPRRRRGVRGRRAAARGVALVNAPLPVTISSPAWRASPPTRTPATRC